MIIFNRFRCSLDLKQGVWLYFFTEILKISTVKPLLTTTPEQPPKLNNELPEPLPTQKIIIF